MSETPGPAGDVALDAERPLRRRAVVEDRIHVPDQQDVGAAVAAPAARSAGRRALVHRPSCGRRSTSQPDPRNRRSHMSAIRFTPRGEYEPQSTLTMVSSSARNSSERASARSRRPERPWVTPTLACAARSRTESACRGSRSAPWSKRPGPECGSRRSSIDPPGPGEVLVRVVASGVCHSDLWAIEHGNWGAPFPMLLGHEGAGIVEEVGDGVETPVAGRSRSCWPGRCPAAVRSRAAAASRAAAPTRGCSRRALPRAGRRAALGTLSLGDPRHPHRRARRAGDPDAGRAAARAQLPARLRRLHRRRRRDRDGAGAARRRVAVIGLGGIGLAALQGARIAGAER